MTIEKFIQETFTESSCFRPRIICNDGFSFSVQCSYGHYCLPRKTQNSYTALEVGCPSEQEPLIFKFAENKNNLLETAYAYVPIKIIQQVIEKHGGINVEETLNSEVAA